MRSTDAARRAARFGSNASLRGGTHDASEPTQFSRCRLPPAHCWRPDSGHRPPTRRPRRWREISRRAADHAGRARRAHREGPVAHAARPDRRALVEAGSSLEYFTGIRWWRSERTTAALIPATGKTIVVTPFFEVPSVEEIAAGRRRRPPLARGPEPLRADRGGACADRAAGPLAVEWTTRFFIVDHTRAVPGFGRDDRLRRGAGQRLPDDQVAGGARADAGRPTTSRWPRSATRTRRRRSA